MKRYSTITIEGNILSFEIIDQISEGKSENIDGQKNSDFGFDKTVNIKDKISDAWGELHFNWQQFKRKRSKLKDNESGTSLVRLNFIEPLLNEFDYEIEENKTADRYNLKISHFDKKSEKFPIHIVGCRVKLDKIYQYKRSPHGLLQEFLNLHDQLYGIVTNGLKLRILRDSSRFIKLSYIEFNLEKMFEESHFSDFAILYRILHHSRVISKGENISILEKYHLKSLDEGSRIRDNLSEAVEKGIKKLADGFIHENIELKQKIIDDNIDVKGFYKEILYLIYRHLFLFVIEERNLVFSKEHNGKFKEIYDNYYSLSRIRKVAESSSFYEKRYKDLWKSVKKTFLLFEDEDIGGYLGIKPLGGVLFSRGAFDLLRDYELQNGVLIKFYRDLILFEDSNITKRVNYGGLNVEEFGSIYEKLLEYEPTFKIDGDKVEFLFKKGVERSSSGSHYTPDELVKPLIENSLDHIIDKIYKDGKNLSKTSELDIDKLIEKKLLSLSICDPACGSGHMLLNCARRIGFELAKIRSKEEQPGVEYVRKGIRDSILNNIYGVDRNELAVELCKVALWLESHTPGEPLHLLDHKIRCGDAVVGVSKMEHLDQDLPKEGYKKVAGDDPVVIKWLNGVLRTQKKQSKLSKSLSFGDIGEDYRDILSDFNKVISMKEATPNDIDLKKAALERFRVGKSYKKLKTVADSRAALYFLDKTEGNKGLIITHDDYKNLKEGTEFENISQKQSKIEAISNDMKFFHWFLEFPMVFNKGGFDLVIGNPPFLGGQKISGSLGDRYLHYLKSNFTPAKSCDLVAFFFRRGFDILKDDKFLSFISTNTISQGVTREVSLDQIYKQNGNINFAIRSKKWPGAANVSVSLINIFKGKWKNSYFLDNRKVEFINPYLTDSIIYGNPNQLKNNDNLSFQGSIILGNGFILSEKEAQEIIKIDKKYKDILFPYLNGADVNRDPLQGTDRWVINFFDWEENYCKDNYPICYDIVKEKVKSERDKLKNNSIGKKRKKYWWLYGSDSKKLYKTIKPLKKVLVVPRVTKYLSFNFQNSDLVYSDATSIIAFDKFYQFCLLQNSLHNEWSWNYCSTMKGDLRYTPTSAFRTFPFPTLNNNQKTTLNTLGEQYHNLRSEICQGLSIGLTKVYNMFHDRGLNGENVEKKEENFGEKGEKTSPLHDDVIKDGEYWYRKIVELRELQRKIDNEVVKIYNFDIKLEHDFYEVDYLPENDRVRYTISEQNRKKVLQLLLKLNLERG